MSHVLTRAPHKWTGPTLAGDEPRCDRERLLRAACLAGLDAHDVIRLAEVLTGRRWESCGRTEIGVIARALLDASNRAISGQSEGTGSCAR